MKLPPEKTAGLIAKLKENNLETAGLVAEIKKMAEAPDRTFGKFCEILSFLEENIPDEKKLYRTAIKALYTASEQTRQDVLKSAGIQLEEIKTVEAEVMAALPDVRAEFQIMESRLREIRDEESNLREKLAGLELEEQEIAAEMAEKQKEAGAAAETLGKVFVEIRDEIIGIKTKLESFIAEEEATAETAPPKSALPDSAATGLPDAPKGPAGEAGKAGEISGIRNVKPQKKCPHCGSQLNFFLNEKKWMCYVCAYEEYEKIKDCAQDNSGLANLPPENNSQCSPTAQLPVFIEEHGPVSKPSVNVAMEFSMTSPAPSFKKKNCPVCKKKMSWYEADKTWRCSSCEYHRMEI